MAAGSVAFSQCRGFGDGGLCTEQADFKLRPLALAGVEELPTGAEESLLLR